ncbi:hypothetical protein [Aliagarivorans marinus]|uniref:hypothetical protein n=1 Tax=Aliagarivorans marinus TaxID=561965 RepID=UPI00042791FC|nr:hypothetical protein [Aliagarivorans marinus]
MKQNLKTWITHHDDSWWFITIYVGAAVSLSMLISMFWLAAVVFAHGVLEWFALAGKPLRFRAVLWHLKLDIVLVIFALWLAVYMDALFGLVGISAAARASAQLSARFALFEKIFRAVMLTIDDALQVIKALLRKGSKAVQIPASNGSWSLADKLTIGSGMALIVAIVVAPYLTQHSYQQVLAILSSELHPWP